jgi:hypothetical protein
VFVYCLVSNFAQNSEVSANLGQFCAENWWKMKKIRAGIQVILLVMFALQDVEGQCVSLT